MANKSVPQMNSLPSSLVTTDLFHVVRTNVDYKIQFSDLLAAVNAGLTAVTATTALTTGVIPVADSASSITDGYLSQGATSVYITNGKTLQSINGNSQLDLGSGTYSQLSTIIAGVGSNIYQSDVEAHIEYTNASIYGNLLLDATMSKFSYTDGTATAMNINDASAAYLNYNKSSVVSQVLAGETQSELSYSDGTDSGTSTINSSLFNIQHSQKITLDAPVINTPNLTASRVVITNGSDNLASSVVTSTELATIGATAQGVIAGYVYTTNGSGVASWQAPSGGGISSLSAIGSTPNANGATITGSALKLQPADDTYGGVVSTTSQTFAGAKTFNNTINGNYLTASTVLISDASKNIVSSSVTITTLGYLDATSSIQTQINDLSNKTRVAYVTANQTTTSSTYADVTDLVLSVEANKKYIIDLFAMLNGSGTSGCVLTAVFPSGTTININTMGSSTDQLQRVSARITASGGNSATFDVLNDTSPVGFAEFKGYFETTNSGNIQIQIKSAVNTQSKTIEKGSYMIIRKLN